VYITTDESGLTDTHSGFGTPEPISGLCNAARPDSSVVMYTDCYSIRGARSIRLNL
jgi:hypothetical protein